MAQWLGWGPREQCSRFNHMEFLLNDVARRRFCWLITANVHVVYCSEPKTECMKGLSFFGLHMCHPGTPGVKTGKDDAGGKGRHVAG